MSITIERAARPILEFRQPAERVIFIIKPDGTMEIGDGISMEDATQRAATMLAEAYSALHKEQAAEIARLRALLDVPA